MLPGTLKSALWPFAIVFSDTWVHAYIQALLLTSLANVPSEYASLSLPMLADGQFNNVDCRTLNSHDSHYWTEKPFAFSTFFS